MSPVRNVARMIFHDVVNSSDTPALTPAFPIIATHRGYRWGASSMRSNALAASPIGRPPQHGDDDIIGRHPGREEAITNLHGEVQRGGRWCDSGCARPDGLRAVTSTRGGDAGTACSRHIVRHLVCLPSEALDG